MLKFGYICEIDEEKAMARVQLDDHDNLISPWLFILERNTLENKDYGMVDVKTQVACMLNDNAETGVILGAIYSKEDMPPVKNKHKYYRKFSDGLWIEYDRENHTLAVGEENDSLLKYNKEEKTVKIGKGEKTISTEHFGDMRINGNLMLTGFIQTDSSFYSRGTIITESSFRAMQNIYADGFIHIHGNINTDGSVIAGGRIL